MIGIGPGTRVMVATRPVDFRKGPDALAALVSADYGGDAFSGVIYVFRAKRADRIKLIWWDGTGLCLMAKRLEQGSFKWPGIQDGVMRLAAAEAVAAEVARIKAINADLEARNALLELQNEKMRRTLYGQRSERTRHLLDQMELAFEECEAAASEDELLAALAAAKTNVAPFERKRPARKPLPEHLPRERVVIAVPEACPCCGSDRLCKLGEDITETLEVVPRQWKVIQTVREKFSCRACEKITQPPAPFHVTPRGLFGPSFLAMLLFEKFGAHQPLNRQRDRYAREGVDLSLSTLADQVGACTAALMPLYGRGVGSLMQRNKVYAVTTLAKVAQEWDESEDLLHELTEQMDTEDGVIWVYGTQEHAVLALSEDGIECLRDLLGEHRRDHR